MSLIVFRIWFVVDCVLDMVSSYEFGAISCLQIGPSVCLSQVVLQSLPL